MTMAKRLITTRLWFLDMDVRVERRVGDCQAGTKVTRKASIRRAMAMLCRAVGHMVSWLW